MPMNRPKYEHKKNEPIPHLEQLATAARKAHWLFFKVQQFPENTSFLKTLITYVITFINLFT